MPRTGGQLTRGKIVRRAADLFRHKGYQAVSIEEILRACDISKGAFYFYFDSKQHLGSAVVDYYADVIPASVGKALDGVSWDKGVETFISHFMGRGGKLQPFGTPLANLGIEYSHTSPMLLRKVAAALGSIEAAIAEALGRCGLDRDEAAGRAGTALSAMIGHQLRLTLTRDPRFIDLAAAQLKALGPSRREPLSAANARARKPSAKAVSAAESVMAADDALFAKITLDSVDDQSIINRVGQLGEARLARLRKRIEILIRAAALMLERGYAATSLDEILADCAVPKGSFHFYFTSKRQLAAAALEFYRLRCEALVERALGRGGWGEAVDALSAAASRIDLTPSAIGCPLANVGSELAATDKALGRKVAQIYQSMEDRFAGGLARSGLSSAQAQERGAYAVALWQGHVTRLVIYRDREILGRLREDFLLLAE